MLICLSAAMIALEWSAISRFFPQPLHAERGVEGFGCQP
jgi:hypothetical protein